MLFYTATARQTFLEMIDGLSLLQTGRVLSRDQVLQLVVEASGSAATWALKACRPDWTESGALVTQMGPSLVEVPALPDTVLSLDALKGQVRVHMVPERMQYLHACINLGILRMWHRIEVHRTSPRNLGEVEITPQGAVMFKRGPAPVLVDVATGNEVSPYAVDTFQTLWIDPTARDVAARPFRGILLIQSGRILPSGTIPEVASAHARMAILHGIQDGFQALGKPAPDLDFLQEWSW